MSTLDKFKTLNVAVAIPSNGVWLTDFATSYCNMITYFQSHRVGEYKHNILQTISTKGSILPKQRSEAVAIALKQQCDYLLWLDSDHTFPRTLLHELLMPKKDVIGINCVTKSIPSTTTARKRTEGGPLWGDLVYSDANSVPRYEKVWRLGCGIMLVDMKVFRAVGPNVFDIRYREDVKAYQGEDWSMCEAFERAGFEIWIDHHMSTHVGHIGYLTYNHSLVGEVVREQFEATNAQ